MGKIYDATWGRGFSALYDRCFKASEEAGLRDMRRDLLAGARGRVLEIGAGTGLNLDLYPDSVESLTLTEPRAGENHPVCRLECSGIHPSFVRRGAGAFTLGHYRFGYLLS